MLNSKHLDTEILKISRNALSLSFDIDPWCPEREQISSSVLLHCSLSAVSTYFTNYVASQAFLQNQPPNFLKEVINQSNLVQLRCVQRRYATRAKTITCCQTSDLSLTGTINQQPLLFSVNMTTAITATILMTLCGRFGGKVGWMSFFNEHICSR